MAADGSDRAGGETLFRSEIDRADEGPILCHQASSFRALHLLPMPSILAHRLAPEFLAGEVRRIARKWWRRARRVDRRVVRLEPEGPLWGRALFSYIIDPFLLAEEGELPYSHTHFWESWTMARCLVEQGFRVDAISWVDQRFRPEEAYDLVVDVRTNLERWAPELGDAVKLLHIDTAHYRFHNPAQERRLRDLEARRGMRIRPQKMLPENRAIETADLATVLGNRFTQETYAFAGKPLFRIPISVPFVYPWPEDKDFAAVRRRFLWFGSGGLVHKGLDLVLEAFAEMPELHLTVCGPIRQERDFEAAYWRELYETENIETLGWIDVGSEAFLELCRKTLGLVYPSCSEGGGSSVLTCMHGSLIPIVNRETSVDLEPDRGILVEESSIPELQQAVRELASRPAEALEATARAAWTFAREHHTRDHFLAGYRSFAGSLADGSWRQVQGGSGDG